MERGRESETVEGKRRKKEKDKMNKELENTSKCVVVGRVMAEVNGSSDW